jgi:hypothetical protein
VFGRTSRSVLVLAADTELVPLDVGHHLLPVALVVVEAHAGGAELEGSGAARNWARSFATVERNRAQIAG